MGEKGKAKNNSAAQGLSYCNFLFKIEEGLADLSPEQRYVSVSKYQSRRTEIHFGQGTVLSQGTMALFAELFEGR